ncbi:MAG: glycosyltransferase family 4 protein [Firmicutes bacterium]|nr:glycosyltransferase family 4 protein [Bacillota bacterium]
MNIALICTDDLPVPAVGGGAIQITVENLAQKLAHNAGVAVYSVQGAGLPEDEEVDGVRYRRFPRSPYVRSVAGDLRRTRPDAVVVFNRPAWVPAIRRACPQAIIVLSLHTHRMDPGWTPPAVARRAVAQADAVVTVSRFLARRLIRRYPRAAGKLRVIYSGVDAGRFAPPEDPEEARRAFGVEGRRVVLFVGRLSRSKGIHLLIGAMPRIVRRHPGAVLLVVGSRWFHGHRSDRFVRGLLRAANRMGGRVRFTGFVPPSEVHRAFQAADVLVCPSQWGEPLARVLYEAMASGLPVVTTARGGNPEVVRPGMNGVVVHRWRSSLALARAVSAVLASPRRGAMGTCGRQMVLERHTWDAAAARWLDLLTGLRALRRWQRLTA